MSALLSPDPPSSPSLPPLFFWQICTLALLAGVVATRHPLAALTACVLLLFCCPVSEKNASFRRVFLLLCALLGFLHMSLAEVTTDPTPPEWLQINKKTEVCGRVVEVVGLPDRRLRILLEDIRPADDADAPPLPGLLNLTWAQNACPDSPRPLKGQSLRFRSRLRPVTSSRNIDAQEEGNDLSAYWARKGVFFTAWIMSRENKPLPVSISGTPSRAAALREQLRLALVHQLGPSVPLHYGGWPLLHDDAHMTQGQAMLPALLFGDRYALDSRTLDLFTRASLVHSLALSGQHLALAMLLASAGALLITLLWPRLFLHWPRRKVIFSLALPLALLYLWIGDVPPSLLRAALMLFAGAWLWLKARISAPLDLLFFAVLCFLIVQPASAFDLSVRLSVLSVAGIMLSGPLLAKIPVRKKIPRFLLQAGLVSLAAQLASLPVILHSFGRLSPGFALNLLWLPVLGFVVLPLAAAGLLFLPLLDGAFSALLFTLAAWPGDMLLELLEWMDEAGQLFVLQGLKPTAFTILGFACALTALSLTATRPEAKICPRLLLAAALLLPLGMVERTAEELLISWQERISLRVLDVGQGQALLLEYPDGDSLRRLLIDGGGSRSSRFDPGRDLVAHALTANSPPQLHAVMATHADLDHVRGLLAIADSFRIDALYHAALPSSCAAKKEGRRLLEKAARRHIPLIKLRSGDVMRLNDSLSLEVVHPPHKGIFSSNDSSLVLRLVRDGQGLALLCGDAENPALTMLLKDKVPLSAQALVMPHHGSASSLLPDFYDAVHPDYALVSSGSYNHFGLPHPDVLHALRERDIGIFNTADRGEIRLVWTKGRDRPELSFGKKVPVN